MGLDQTLFRTTKKCKAAKIAFGKLQEEFYNREKELLSSANWKPFIDSLPKNNFGQLDFGRFTSSQRKRLGIWRRNLHRIAKKIGIKLNEHRRPYMELSEYGLTEADLDEPIAEWRKDWPLHKFIVDNFLEDKENDNLVPIYLSKVDCEKIVAAGFVGGFQDALDRWDDEHEVFYWAWY